jgi:hypothetical protein
MKRTGLIAVCVWLGCLGLVAGAQAVGRSHDAPPTYLDPGDCSQPCWQGMRPGEVTAETLHQYVNLIGRFEMSWSDGNDEGRMNDGVARRFWLYPQNALTFGDVIRVLGPPEVTHCLRVRPTEHGLTAAAEVHYAGGTIQMVVENDRGVHMSPDMRVTVVKYIVSYWALVDHDPHVIPWRGFGGPSVYACLG